MKIVLALVLSTFCLLVCVCAPSHSTPTKDLDYHNKEYGFDVALPPSWTGYTIIQGQWEGRILDAQPEKTEHGPLISIRHPKWTKENPRQDIPIMVFTLNQWKLIQQEKMAVSAAPIGPSELARNAKYVFALPARYNFAYLPGYEEVDRILQNKAVQAR